MPFCWFCNEAADLSLLHDWSASLVGTHSELCRNVKVRIDWSDQVQHNLPFRLHSLNALLHGKTIIEPPYDKNNKMTFAPSKDSDQPGHPPNLISLRCPPEETLGPQLSIKRTAKTLIRLGGGPG